MMRLIALPYFTTDIGTDRRLQRPLILVSFTLLPLNFVVSFSQFRQQKEWVS